MVMFQAVLQECNAKLQRYAPLPPDVSWGTCLITYAFVELWRVCAPNPMGSDPLQTPNCGDPQALKPHSPKTHVLRSAEIERLERANEWAATEAAGQGPY